ncbi:uncharacterized protein LOC117173645 [Belonocnema kinseyi]|uniref:uncharacterized protein LOC117173645 n=1 Tax=Belonocnema kinseyi TaxID=2817044 RepID=UPI00143E065E|nr:uncharacterized protein LOC117173645 [Belonocnema kinseyi]
MDRDGTYSECRFLLDSCSQPHLLTTRMSIRKVLDSRKLSGKKILSVEENECETHYEKHTTRDVVSGRYCVRLPFRENVGEIGESYTNALKRLYSLERTFIKKPEIKNLYIENLRVYHTNGYMSKVRTYSKKEGYYLPHHAVIKNNSLTTQLRVVFDGSAKRPTGLSLNDVLMVGPTIQDNLFTLLVGFRSHPFVLAADIEKMYLQTTVHPDDRKYQRILWREDPSDQIKTYELNTATFGTSAAPFLVIRSLHQLADDEAITFPKASKVLKNDFYVDDMLTGASTIKEAEQLRNELIEITRKGGLSLRKWASNDSSLNEPLLNCSDEPFFQLNLDITANTLGIHWNAKRDSIIFTVNQNNEKKALTKREILSQIAQLFDSLGLLGPVIVYGKILMQKMWLINLGWDAPVPREIHNAWQKYYEQLPLLSNLQFKRKLLVEDCSTLQLHGFSDSSEKAYGAAIYVRSTSNQGRHETYLICSKSRVAPIKSLSLPRLELSAALLLAQLYEATAQALRHLTFEKVIFWSDSTITLHWVNTSLNLLPTFERNRVSNITAITSSIENHEWRHVRSKSNPADLISRGLMPRELLDSQLWLNGPIWMNKKEDLWPESVLKFSENSDSTKHVASLSVNKIKILESSAEPFMERLTVKILEHFSSSNELNRFIACCKRVIHNAKSEIKLTGELTIKELKSAIITMIRLIQEDGFPDELKSLKSKGHLNGNLNNVAPFIYSDGIMRVGGRIDKSNLSFSQKHAALLPHHYFTDVLIREEHIKSMHDNATNFVSANNEIVDIQNLLSSHEHNKSVEITLTNDNIAWHVIPPRSPHFGGLWEAAVRSFKHHLLRVVGNTLLTYEDLLTLITEIEAILNSRPPTPISSDPNDLSTLTPAHFLIGDSFRSMPERHLTEIPLV